MARFSDFWLRPGEQLHPVPPCRADQGEAVFFRQRDGFRCGRSLACENGDPGPDGFHGHVRGNPAAGIDHAPGKRNPVTQGIANGFIQGIVPADILALEEKLAVLCQKTAVGGPGLSMERHTCVEAVGQIKDLLCLPGNGSHWLYRLPGQKIII